jgi:4-amino-4-deoxy-L-arabinose transferase-like glycosyltransferase
MAILLLFIFLFGLINYIFQKKKSLSLAFIYATIIWSISTILITEISSFFKAYNYTSSIVFWSILAVGITYLNLNKHCIKITPYLTWYKENKKISLFFGGFTILLLIQGIIYPPNNWDSMTYHMARITHWVMNESIEPYPTHIYRQIYQPPLAEWMISQICLLNKADYFANSLQLFFLLATLGVINLLIHLLKLDRKTRITALILVFTTPSIFMQATATQNDIVVGFFIVCIIYFLLLFFKEKNNISSLLLGISIGCALLTKGTAFVYLIPIMCLGMILLIQNIFQKQFIFLKDIQLLILIVSMSISIPFKHYYRNYELSHDIFGASDDHYFNENPSIQSTSLGLIKNIGIHLSTPLTASLTNQVIEKSHLICKIPINDTKYTYKGIHFKLNQWNHNEDEVSNVLQIILFVILLFYLIFKPFSTSTIFKYTAFFCIATFFIFTFILKWQPWHIRLQVPLFILLAIPSAIILNSSKNDKIQLTTVFIAALYCLLLAFYNPNRPIIKNCKQRKIETRFDKFFVAMPLYLSEYKLWRYKLNKNIKTNWDVHGDTWEYPIYYDCFSSKREELNIVHIKNKSKYAIK